MIYEVEGAKLALCEQIRSWKLDDDNNCSVNLRWLQDPFQRDSGHAVVQFSARDLRGVSFSASGKRDLSRLSAMSSLRRAPETGGSPLDFLLLSGGSANIQWLRELIIRDFGNQLDEQQILKLDDYQEVVSKGLAIECTRRFYSPDGDFGSTTIIRSICR